MIDQSVIVST